MTNHAWTEMQAATDYRPRRWQRRWWVAGRCAVPLAAAQTPTDRNRGQHRPQLGARRAALVCGARRSWPCRAATDSHPQPWWSWWWWSLLPLLSPAASHCHPAQSGRGGAAWSVGECRAHWVPVRSRLLRSIRAEDGIWLCIYPVGGLHQSSSCTFPSAHHIAARTGRKCLAKCRTRLAAFPVRQAQRQRLHGWRVGALTLPLAHR